MPSPLPALEFFYSLPFLIFLCIIYQPPTYYALVYFLTGICHTQPAYKLFEGKDFVLFTSTSPHNM